ncbi:maltokinase N-terminal cap-like domain-containing protein [Streptomyces sp. ODS05-4]|uniref:maltokinase N-terminal cap-like domain-containing protein n=1 Tax=Streptomyces sp. ODS05-4 TaxID=2944939 RepID=UPI00210E8429|nr:1,4-alpha-glucan branching protein [Streptomyces sp. ODS05-4]
MAVIHETTVTPTKLELLAAWLPGRPWYAGSAPDLERAGGFRLDDPDGEVGIEFMVVNDSAGGEPVSYLVPVAYRGAPLDGAEDALVGTMEHGVLGKRWVYDGAHDPVVQAQLLAFLAGRAEPQAQSVSDTPDPSVVAHTPGGALPAGLAATGVADGPDGTDVSVREGGADGNGSGDGDGGELTLKLVRVLQGERQTGPETDPATTRAYATADWNLPAGGRARGLIAMLRDAIR